MQLASIKPDQKYKRKDPNNKCLITRKMLKTGMEKLDLYESCVEPDPEEKLRIEPPDKKEDAVMKQKVDGNSQTPL